MEEEDVSPPIEDENVTDVSFNISAMFENSFAHEAYAMKNSFAYLCDLSYDDSMHSFEHTHNVFSIHDTTLT